MADPVLQCRDEDCVQREMPGFLHELYGQQLGVEDGVNRVLELRAEGR